MSKTNKAMFIKIGLGFVLGVGVAIAQHKACQIIDKTVDRVYLKQS